MKEFKDKLNRKLEELIDKSFNESLKGYPFACARNGAYQEVKMIIDQLSEEYNKDCCEWKQYDENDIYYTGCEQIHMFIDGSPTDNKYEFCPYCGKKIKVAPYMEGE